jgi:two-component system LytT family response regulator
MSGAPVITAILVDDELRGLKAMHEMLQAHCPQVQVLACCRSADEARETIPALKPQLVFLDIAMPGKNGIELLNEMPAIFFEIIFITAHSNYMLPAFHFSAVDYLLKPVEEDLLIDAVKRAEKRIGNKKDNRHFDAFLHNIRQLASPFGMRLCIPSLKGLQVVELKDIIYGEAKGNYTNLVFESGAVICASKPIHEYEALLADCGFLRIHKSYLVNIIHIREYRRGMGGTVLLSNHFEAEVSRRKKEWLMEKMQEHFKF